jgi:hypothetical protein
MSRTSGREKIREIYSMSKKTVEEVQEDLLLNTSSGTDMFSSTQLSKRKI